MTVFEPKAALNNAHDDAEVTITDFSNNQNGIKRVALVKASKDDATGQVAIVPYGAHLEQSAVMVWDLETGEAR